MISFWPIWMVQIVRHQLCRWLLISWVVQCTALRSMTLFVEWYLPPSLCASESTCWTNFYILFSSNNCCFFNLAIIFLAEFDRNSGIDGAGSSEFESGKCLDCIFFLHTCVWFDLYFSWFIAFEFTEFTLAFYNWDRTACGLNKDC